MSAEAEHPKIFIFNWMTGDDQEGLCDIRFFNEQGVTIRQEQIQKNDSVVWVPPSATTFSISNNSVTARILTVPEEHYGAYDVRMERAYLNDIRRALGNRSLKPYEIMLESGLKPR